MSAAPAAHSESPPRTKLPRDFVCTAVLGGAVIVVAFVCQLVTDSASIAQTIGFMSGLGS